MTHFRDFSSSGQFQPPVRNIDFDAPEGMRHELIYLIFHLAERNPPPLSDGYMHRIFCQSLGERVAGNPYGGFRYAVGRDLAKADWQRVYDLICRLWPEFESAGVTEDYRQGINHIFAAYSVVWELTEEDRP